MKGKDESYAFSAEIGEMRAELREVQGAIRQLGWRVEQLEAVRERTSQVMGFVVTPLLLLAVAIGSTAFFVNNPGGAMAARVLTYDNILKLTGQHVWLVIFSSMWAILCAVPVGIFITRPRFKRFAPLVVNTANVGQTIPSIAILGLFMTILGLGFNTAAFALWLYSLLPILRNTCAGIEGVSPDIIEAATGMGMTRWQILYKIELPLALAVIFAGIRTATVINVGTAALATFIGAGGLGDLIVIGLSLARNRIMLAGGILTALLAILADFVLGKIETQLVPPS